MNNCIVYTLYNKKNFYRLKLLCVTFCDFCHIYKNKNCNQMEGMKNMKKTQKKNHLKPITIFSVVKTTGFVVMLLILLFIILLAISPIILRVDFADNLLSKILVPLKSSEYKSTYVETLGALSGAFLGAFLGVLGAHYSQLKHEEKSKQKEIKESATIVYYDFNFAIDESKVNFCKAEEKHNRSIFGIKNPYSYYTQLQKSYNVRIDKDWIHNVAKLCHVMEDAEIKLIYSIYGDLESISDSFNKNLKGIEIHRVFYSFMKKYFEVDQLTGKLLIKNGDFVLKVKYSNLLKKLKELSDISDNVDRLLNE